MSVLKVDRDGAVAIVTMNRPDSHNAANAALHKRLANVWTELAEDTEIHAVVLTGAGDSFCAGGDFALMKATREDPSVADAVFGEARQTVLGMLALPQPIVAAINGPAVGLGASLAALCDISVAADTAFLSDPHLGVGLVPGDGAAILWPLLIGLGRAKEFVLLGEKISAIEAHRIGLVNRVVPAGETANAALEIARRLAKVPHRALQDTKRIMNAHTRQTVVAVLDHAIAAERSSVVSPEHAAKVEKMMAKSAVNRQTPSAAPTEKII